MIDPGTVELFAGNIGRPAGEPATLGQELFRIFRGLHVHPVKDRQQEFAWSYEEFGNGIPDDIPD